jgi:hypothetical protein
LKEAVVEPAQIADSLRNFILTYVILFFFCLCAMGVGIMNEGCFIIVSSMVVIWIFVAQIYLLVQLRKLRASYYGAEKSLIT